MALKGAFRWFVLMACGFCLTQQAWAMGTREKGPPEILALPEQPRAAWLSLLDEGIKIGINRSRLEKTAARMAKADIAPDEAREILSHAFDAARKGLPASPVLSKIEEGSLKGAFPKALEFTARRRLESLIKARDLPPGAISVAERS